MRRAATLLGLALALAGGARAGQPAFDPFGQAKIERLPDARASLDAPLIDASGRPTTLAALGGGKPIVLAPIQHRCPNLCGFTLDGLIAAVRSQSFRPGRDFEVVALGFDPRETPRDAQVSAARLRRGLGVDGRAVGAAAVVGSGVQAITRALGYRYAWDPDQKQYAHIAAVAVLTPDGRLARWLYGLQPQGDDLKLALTEAGQGRIGGWTDQLLLLCYHYDPQTGRYAPLIWTLLRLGGVVTLLGLAGLILGLTRRRKPRAPS